MSKARLAVLASGNGSNLQAILDACANGALNAAVVVVVCNRKDAYALPRAEQIGIPALYHPLKWFTDTGRSRADYDAALADLIEPYKPDFVVLAGWMHILSNAFLQHFPNRVINLHPALPGTFPGVNAIERAYEAHQHGEIAKTGLMIHFVPDEGVDTGPAIAIKHIEFTDGESLEDFTVRMHAEEHHLLVQAIQALLNGNGSE